MMWKVPKEYLDQQEEIDRLQAENERLKEELNYANGKINKLLDENKSLSKSYVKLLKIKNLMSWFGPTSYPLSENDKVKRNMVEAILDIIDKED